MQMGLKMEAGDCPTLNMNAKENYLLSQSLSIALFYVQECTTFYESYMDMSVNAFQLHWAQKKYRSQGIFFFFAIFNFLIFYCSGSTVKNKSAKCVIFSEVLHRYIKTCTVWGIWNGAGKLDTSKPPVPTFCQLLPPECALGLTMDLNCDRNRFSTLC